MPRRRARTHADAVVAATRDSRLRIQQEHFQQYGPKAHFKNAVSEIRNRWLDDVDPRKRLKRNLFISKSYIKRAFEHARQTSPSGGSVDLYPGGRRRVKSAPLRLSEHAVAAVRLMMLKLTEMYLWKAALIALLQNKTRVSAKHLIAASLMDNTQMRNNEDPQFNLTEQNEVVWQAGRQAALQVRRTLQQITERVLLTGRPAIVFINSLDQVEVLPIIPAAYERSLLTPTSSHTTLNLQTDTQAYANLAETLHQNTALYLAPVARNSGGGGGGDTSRITIRRVNEDVLQTLVTQQIEFLDNILDFVSRPVNRIAELVFYDVENRMRVTMVDPAWLSFLISQPLSNNNQSQRTLARNAHMRTFGIDVLQLTSRQRLQTALRNMTLLVLQTTPRSPAEQRRVRAVYGPEVSDVALVRATIASFDAVSAYLSTEEGDLMSALSHLYDDPNNVLFVHRDAQGARLMHLWQQPDATAKNNTVSNTTRNAVERLWIPLSSRNELDESALSQVVSKWQVGQPMMITFRERSGSQRAAATSSSSSSGSKHGWDVSVMDMSVFIQTLNALIQVGALSALTLTTPAEFAFGAATVEGGRRSSGRSANAAMQQRLSHDFAEQSAAEILSPLYAIDEQQQQQQRGASLIPESPMPVPWSPSFLEDTNIGVGGYNNMPLQPQWFEEDELIPGAVPTSSWRRASSSRNNEDFDVYGILNASNDEF